MSFKSSHQINHENFIISSNLKLTFNFDHTFEIIYKVTGDDYNNDDCTITGTIEKDMNYNEQFKSIHYIMKINEVIDNKTNKRSRNFDPNQNQNKYDHLVILNDPRTYVYTDDIYKIFFVNPGSTKQHNDGLINYDAILTIHSYLTQGITFHLVKDLNVDESKSKNIHEAIMSQINEITKINKMNEMSNNNGKSNKLY